MASPRILIALSAAMAVLLGAARSQPVTRTASRIAYVSLQRLGARSTSAQTAAKKLEGRRNELTLAITEKQKAVDTLRLRAARSGGVFRASERQRLLGEAERARTELQKLRDDSQHEIQTLQQELQATFRKDLVTVIQDLAKRRGFDILLNEDTAVVWSIPGVDLTDDAATSLNALVK